MRRLVSILVVLIIVACIAAPVIVLSLQGAKPSAQTVAAALQKAVVDRGDLKLTVNATGNVVAKQQTSLSFDLPSRVQEVLVEEGQKVQAGDLLVRVDNTAQHAALDRATASLKAANAALQSLLKPVDAGLVANAEANVKAAQNAYSSIANTFSQDQIQAYELQYQQAVAAAANTEEIRRETGGRWPNADPGYQKSVAQVGQASFDTEIARLRLAQVKNGRSLLSATAQISLAQVRLAQVKAGPKQVDIDAAQAQVVNAQLLRDQSQHQLDKTSLRAPFAGVVTTVNVKTGQMSAGPAIVLTDISGFFVDIGVDEVDIGKIQPGQPVEYALDGLPGVTLNGNVQRIAQLTDENASVIKYLVRVIPDSTSQSAKMGMTANATFTVHEAKNVLRIQNEYLRVDRTNNRVSVNRVNADGTLTDVPVTLGLEGTDYSEVLAGLHEGDTVALGGTTATGG